MDKNEEEYFEEQKRRKIIHQMTINAKNLSFDGFAHDFHIEEQEIEQEIIKETKPIVKINSDGFNKKSKSLL